MTNSLSPTALHAAIMNLPGIPERNDVTFVLGYRAGHRDARHAAAELVGPEEDGPYELRFKTMTLGEYEALGEFNGF